MNPNKQREKIEKKLRRLFRENKNNTLSVNEILSLVERDYKVDCHCFKDRNDFDLSELSSFVTDQIVKRRLSYKKEFTDSEIPLVKSKECYWVSYTQKRLFILYKLEPESSFYNNTDRTWHLTGPLNTAALKQAATKLIQRHESLRTNFKEIKGEPVQFIHSKPTTSLKLKDLTKFSKKEKQGQKDKLIKKIAQTPFKLETEPLLRMVLIKEKENKTKTNNNQYTLVVAMHHIISDAWSMNIFYRELSEFYNAIMENREPNLPSLPIQYKDYAEWERSEENQKRLKQQEKFWLRELKKPLPVLNLPTDKPRPPVQSYKGETQILTLDKETTRKIKKAAKETNTTLFTFLFTAFNVFLHRLTGDKDIIVGTLRASRDYPELENLIGLMHNNLAIRTKINPELSFEEFLKQTKEKVIEATANGEYSFDKLVDKINPDRDMSRPPIFNVLFQVLDKNTGSGLGLKGVSLNSEAMEKQETSQFDLTVVARENRVNLNIFLNYNKDLFEADTIGVFLEIFKILLVQAAEDFKNNIFKYSIISSHHQKLINNFNKTEKHYSEIKTLSDIIEKQAKKTPDNLAVEFNGQKLTYKELNRKANQLACCLLNRGVKPGRPVALYLERSLDSIVYILAIIKTGACYVPLDPLYPDSVTSHLLKACRPRYVVTKNSYLTNLLQILPDKSSVICFDIFDDSNDSKAKKVMGLTKAEKTSNKNPSIKRNPRDLAYVIYTSGSTGDPKGVMISHRAILNTLFWLQREFKLNPDKDVVAQKTSLAFTDSVWEIFWPLITGTKISIIDTETVKDPRLFIQKLNREKVTYTQFVPALMTMFLGFVESKKGKREFRLPYLKFVFNGGEHLSPRLANRWYRQFANISIGNIYGMTESAIYATKYIVPLNSDESKISVPIGKPISNAQVYILDQNNQILPPGLSGEICISGAVLSDGYYLRPDLTKQAFVYLSSVEKTVYKTGDIGKIDSWGLLQYLGRKNHQINLRGYKIDLVEIESKIYSFDGIKQAAVILRRDNNDYDNLLAYFSSTRNSVTSINLKNYLKNCLPGYMIPDRFIRLESLPLNRNGKIDKKSLPEIKEGDHIENMCQPPQGPVEKRLAQIWEEVLGVKKVSRHDNFFNLGGHSLKAIELLIKIGNNFNLEFSFKNVFFHSDFFSMANVLRQEIIKRSKINIK